MINLIENNIEMNYRIYNSEFIANTFTAIKFEGRMHHSKYRNMFKDSKNGSTWDYKIYNIFSLAAGSELFYQIYKDLIFVVKDYIKDQKEIPNSYWIQSWLNYHKQDEVLDWHDHPYLYHGYISIDPKDTTIEFKKYSIQSKPGNIYIGLGNNPHRVVVNTPYTDTRITLGFDILTSLDRTDSLSFIPII